VKNAGIPRYTLNEQRGLISQYFRHCEEARGSNLLADSSMEIASVDEKSASQGRIFLGDVLTVLVMILRSE